MNLTLAIGHDDGNLNDLNRIEVFLSDSESPIYVIPIKTNQTTITISIPLYVFMTNYKGSGSQNYQIIIRLIDNFGKVNNAITYTDVTYSFYLENLSLEFPTSTLIQEINITFSPTIVVEEVNDSNDPSFNFEMTFVFYSVGPTKVSLAMMVGDSYDSLYSGNAHHDRLPYTNNSYSSYDIFNGKSIGSYYHQCGVLFWITALDSAQISSMIVKIKYPSGMEPDFSTGAAPLKALHWVPSCDQNNNGMGGRWNVLDSSLVKNKTTDTKEISITDMGLYGFGQDSYDYESNNSSSGYIPGYSLITLIAASAIGISVMIQKKNKQIRM